MLCLEGCFVSLRCVSVFRGSGGQPFQNHIISQMHPGKETQADEFTTAAAPSSSIDHGPETRFLSNGAKAPTPVPFKSFQVCLLITAYVFRNIVWGV